MQNFPILKYWHLIPRRMLTYTKLVWGLDLASRCHVVPSTTKVSSLPYHIHWLWSPPLLPSPQAKGKKQVCGTGFPNLNVCTNHLGILLTCRFCFLTSEVGLKTLSISIAQWRLLKVTQLATGRAASRTQVFALPCFGVLIHQWACCLLASVSRFLLWLHPIITLTLNLT